MLKVTRESHFTYTHQSLHMKARYYSPQIQRFLVCAIFHEALAKGIPMTTLVNQVLAHALADTDGWRKAQEAGHKLEPMKP